MRVSSHVLGGNKAIARQGSRVRRLAGLPNGRRRVLAGILGNGGALVSAP
jgi:hypothetical protein